MFTGLIQKTGKLAALTPTGPGWRLTVSASWTPPLAPGESIAVDGICLTAAEIRTDSFVCDILEETLQRTNLRSKQPGTRLNLERALRAGDHLGGHLVTGHIDGTGTIQHIRHAGADLVLEIGCAPELLAQIVPKGSIAVDGASLTVAEINRSSGTFAVHLIPFTRKETTLGELARGDTVNLETDIIGKYVRQYLQNAAAAEKSSTLTWERLQQAGF